MKAGIVYGKEDIRYGDIPQPVPADGEVLIRVKYTGICGSDIPRVNGTACHFYPNVLGHEFSGIVAETGANVDTLQKGDRVAGIPLIPCGRCTACQSGHYALCKNYSFIGSRRFGSFAEYVTVPAQNAVRFSNDVSFEQGAFFEPATVALHGLERTGYRGGGSVAILGGGTVGLFAMQWARIFGAEKVAVFDIVPERLVLAKKLGADAGFSTLDAGFWEHVAAFTDGSGFDYVFETAGNAATIVLAPQLAGSRAQVCYIGTPTRELSFTVEQWENINRKELTVTGSWMSYSMPFPGHEWRMTAHCFGNGQLRFDPELIFRTMPLCKIDEAFAMYRKPGTVKGKILIDCEA